MNLAVISVYTLDMGSTVYSQYCAYMGAYSSDVL